MRFHVTSIFIGCIWLLVRFLIFETKIETWKIIYDCIWCILWFYSKIKHVNNVIQNIHINIFTFSHQTINTRYLRCISHIDIDINLPRWQIELVFNSDILHVHWNLFSYKWIGPFILICNGEHQIIFGKLPQTISRVTWINKLSIVDICMRKVFIIINSIWIQSWIQSWCN